MATYGQRERAEARSLERALDRERRRLAELSADERQELDEKRRRLLEKLGAK